jgi:eukaryotic-like serine/threonine-protein kinase
MSTMVGQYELLELLGEGGIGQVHAARDTVLGREVAIKSLRPELLNDASFVERFRAEATNLARLNHPNISTLYTLLAEGKHLYMVMELVRGRTLETILKERGGAFSVREAIAVVSQAAEGLSYAHGMGIIHRDIKPANMIINDGGLLKIMDFGIARVQGSQRLTRDGTIVGTLAYMAPEQLRAEEVDARTDLYSLAIVFYEMLSGAVPFSAASDYDLMRAQIHEAPGRLTSRVPGLDASVEKALIKALSKNPDDRFPSVAAFRDALGASVARSEIEQLTKNATRVGTMLAATDIPVIKPARKGAAAPLVRGFAIGTAVVVGIGIIALVLQTLLAPPSQKIADLSKFGARPGVSAAAPARQVAEAPRSPSLPTGAMPSSEGFVRAGAPVSSPSVGPANLPSSGNSANPASDIDADVGSVPGPKVATAALPETAVAYYEKKDYQAARTLAEPLAKNGDAECEFIMGVLYDDGLGGVDRDSFRAFDWYRKSANQGYVKAEFNLAVMYDNGEGTPPNKAEAFNWYYRAAEKNYASAQLDVGLIYRNGMNGVTKDEQLARQWLGKAAASDNPEIAQKAKTALDSMSKGR